MLARGAETSSQWLYESPDPRVSKLSQAERNNGGWNWSDLGCFRRCSSSIPLSGSPQHCLSCHPHSCRSPYPQLSQGYWAPDSPPSRPLRPCPLSTSHTFPNSVHILCRIPRSDDNSRPGQVVSATRNVSRRTHSHSVCNDAVARRVRRIFDKQARRRLRHGRLVSSARAWVGL